ncbi:hypothetical protein V6N11_000402 [Hibiscus sabdariffa]|uniref:Uncharacterized protein n=1 Tax=Hibiscus sabdariffa TaxID=183260 RepID=A0ABR2NSX7_9ROSI
MIVLFSHLRRLQARVNIIFHLVLKATIVSKQYIANGYNFTGKGAVGGQSRRVDGVIDKEKLSVLETCTLGWVKEAVLMRVLAKEMAVAGVSCLRMSYRHGLTILRNGQRRRSTHPGVLGYLSVASQLTYGRKDHSVTLLGLWGKYLRVDAATEESTSFERARILIETSVRGRIDEVVEVASLGTMFLIVVQEAELVRVPVVEQRGVTDGAALSEQSQEASVASPRKNFLVEQVGDDSSYWHANQLWEIESAQKGRGASMVVGGASDHVVCDRGGVCSEGDADFAFTRIQSREGLDIVHPSVSIAEHDYLGVRVVGDCESAEKYGRVVSVNGEGAPLTLGLGLAGAATAPVIGSAHRGARTVKSVNTLVEALGSPAQKRVIAAARSRRGRG